MEVVTWFYDFLNTEYLVATREDIGADWVITFIQKEIVKEMGHLNMTLKEFTDMIRKDPLNFYKSPDELLANGHILEIFQNKPVT